MRAALALGLCLMLSGCAMPAPSDLVQDEQAAIQIAKKLCVWSKEFPKPDLPDERWFANFHDGIWHVWSVWNRNDATGEPFRNDQPSNAAEYVEINPKDGSSPDGCGIMND